MKGKKHKSYGKKPLLKQKKQKESKTIISLPFLEGLFNRSNFVTFISVICIILFIMLQIMEKRIANGPQIQNFINSSYESFVLPKPPDIAAVNSAPGKKKRFPGFIIIGMQKCGTGALKEFLKRNPFIGYSIDGECHFFDRGTNYQQGYEYYLSKQPEVTPEVMVFDKTPSLLSDHYMPERVAAYNKDVKLIVMLCDPIRRSLSHYLHAITLIEARIEGEQMGKKEFVPRAPGAFRTFVYNSSSFADVADAGIDEIFKKRPDAKAAVNNMADDFTDHNLIREAIYEYIDDKNNYAMSQAIPQQLITRGCYGYYLNRWFDIFPRENIMVLSSSDLLTEPGRVLQKVQEFVGVQVVVDEKNFVWDKGSEHYCIIGPEDLTPKCMGSRKQRSKEFTVNEETKIKLTRIFSSIHRDLSDIVGKELFKSWDMDI